MYWNFPSIRYELRGTASPGNAWEIDRNVTNLKYIQEKCLVFCISFFFFFFPLLISQLISALDCFYPVLDAEINFLGNERISFLKRSFPTISTKWVQTLLILCSFIHNSNLCFRPACHKWLTVYESLPLRFAEIWNIDPRRRQMTLKVQSPFTLKQDQIIVGSNIELYRNILLCL